MNENPFGITFVRFRDILRNSYVFLYFLKITPWIFFSNFCNLEGKFIIQMDILVFFLHKSLKICQKLTFLTQFVTISQGNFAFFPALGMEFAIKMKHFLFMRRWRKKLGIDIFCDRYLNSFDSVTYGPRYVFEF